jgi:uncharacterized protein
MLGLKMIFEWDDKKDTANIIKHGFSFEDAIRIFADDRRIVAVDNRIDYGEERLVTTGYINSRLCVVVYTEQGDIIRIISARKANEREKKKHGNR